MEIIVYGVFNCNDCYILKTNKKIEADDFGNEGAVYCTDVEVSNFQGTTTDYDGTARRIYSHLKYMYQINKKYKVTDI